VVSRALEQQVRLRAGGVCEYCLFPEALHVYPFHIEHIISRKHRGPSEIDNLCLSCDLCNLHKGSDIAGLDPMTGALTPLFNPRRDAWQSHFTWDNGRVVGLTDIGRVTLYVLDMNAPARIRVRRLLIATGLLRITQRPNA
jgi:hypothetical protein